jgi:hypothetical protein
MGSLLSRMISDPNGPIKTMIKRVGTAIAQPTIPAAPATPAPPAPLVFSNPERASRIENSLQNASFGGADIRSILEQLLKSNYLAAGGRVGYEMGGDVMNQYSENIKYNPDLGQFVNSTNQQPVDQTELLQWSAQNPEPLKNTESNRSSITCTTNTNIEIITKII